MEAMSIEQLVASRWEFDGFLTRVRWPIWLERGYSDIDVVGASAAGVVRLAECKVRGPARSVYVVANGIEDWLDDWSSCLDNISRLWEERPAWLPNPSDVEQVEMWFCSNVWFSSKDELEYAQSEFTAMVRDACPHGLKGKAVGRVVYTRDVLLELVQGVRKRIVEEEFGKRFGEPVMDVVRELVRYLYPRPEGGGRVRDEIAFESRTALLGAFGLEET